MQSHTEDYSTLGWLHTRMKTDDGSYEKQETEDGEVHTDNNQSEKKQTEGVNGKAAEGPGSLQVSTG